VILLKRIFSLVLTVVICLTVFAVALSASAADSSASSLNIHAIYLTKASDGSAGEGDAVLVESDGHYLLMDAGMGYYPYADNESTVRNNDVSQSIMDYMDSVGIDESTPLDIYVSHIHNDHFGGIYNIIMSGKYNIGKLYVPARALGNANQDHDFVYRNVFTNEMGRYVVADDSGNVTDYFDGIEVVYLAPNTIDCGEEAVTNQFTFGNATVDIIGPVRICTEELVNQVFPSYENIKTDQLENNNSLCAVISCGNSKFLSMGDALDFEEMDLVNAYKNTDTLKADVFKENHHGYAKTGSFATNVEDFIAQVRPKYAFCQNKAVQSNVTVPRTIRRSGEAVDIFAEEKTIVFQLVTDDNGETEIKRTFCHHPLESKTVTAEKIENDMEKHRLVVTCNECGETIAAKEGHIWDSDGKCTVCGYECPHTYVKEDTGEVKNNYSSIDQCCLNCRMHCKHKEWWATVNDYPGYEKCKTCYLLCNHPELDSEGKCVLCGKICDGFVTEGENTYYYENGAAVKSTLKTIDGKIYYFASNGVMFKKRLASVDGKKYYFGADGAAYTKRLISVSGKKYYMGADGVAYTSRLISVSGKKYYMGSDGAAYTKRLVSLSGKKYYFGSDGVAYKSKLISVSGKKYYIGSDCVAYKNKFGTISGKKYYFGGDSAAVTSKLISVNGKKYYLGKDGVAYKSKLISVSGKKYYIGSDYVAYKSKFGTISGKKYYFGADCAMYKSKTFSVSGVKWKADSNGVCRKA
jgi:glucan-binding YG repeat protein/beta-lactamase superfamily II metal-dependent hydrolase